MINKLSGWEDTIVALATPPGIGAIGVIRLSGGAAIEIINSLFVAKDLATKPSHTLHVGLLKEEDKAIDEVVETPPDPETIDEIVETDAISIDPEPVEPVTIAIEPPEELPENRRRKRRSSATVD